MGLAQTSLLFPRVQLATPASPILSLIAGGHQPEWPRLLSSLVSQFGDIPSQEVKQRDSNPDHALAFYNPETKELKLLSA